MKLLLTFFIFLSLMHQSLAQVNAGDISKIIEEIRTKYAPDKRTAIFSINHVSDEKSIILTGETNLPYAKKELLSLLKNLNIVDQINMLPSMDLGTKIYGIVNLSVADVRTKPEHSAELATQVMLGSKLNILKSSGEWYLVQCEDDYIGWMDNDGVFLMDHEKFNEWNKAKKIIVTTPFTFAYSEQNVNSTPVSDVVQGNLLNFISREEDFVKVKFPDERIAFISNDQVRDYDEWLATRNQSYDAINHTAHMMMGIPYVWGGTSIKGLDCSGFTKLVFQLNGVQLPRDASQQVHVGELIDTKNGFDNLMPGDLLFFGRMDHNVGKERITHVAIYLGNLQFIHASGRVQINSFDETKSNFAEGRLRTFIKAKRILSSLGRNEVKLIKDLNKNYK